MVDNIPAKDAHVGDPGVRVRLPYLLPILESAVHGGQPASKPGGCLMKAAEFDSPILCQCRIIIQ